MGTGGATALVSPDVCIENRCKRLVIVAAGLWPALGASHKDAATVFKELSTINWSSDIYIQDFGN